MPTFGYHCLLFWQLPVMIICHSINRVLMVSEIICHFDDNFRYFKWSNLSVVFEINFLLLLSNWFLKPVISWVLENNWLYSFMLLLFIIVYKLNAEMAFLWVDRLWNRLVNILHTYLVMQARWLSRVKNVEYRAAFGHNWPVLPCCVFFMCRSPFS